MFVSIRISQCFLGILILRGGGGCFSEILPKVLCFVCLSLCLAAESTPCCIPVSAQTHTHTSPRSCWLRMGWCCLCPNLHRAAGGRTGLRTSSSRLPVCILCAILPCAPGLPGQHFCVLPLPPPCSDNIPQTPGLSWASYPLPTDTYAWYCGQ